MSCHDRFAEPSPPRCVGSYRPPCWAHGRGVTWFRFEPRSRVDHGCSSCGGKGRGKGASSSAGGGASDLRTLGGGPSNQMMLNREEFLFLTLLIACAAFRRYNRCVGHEAKPTSVLSPRAPFHLWCLSCTPFVAVRPSVIQFLSPRSAHASHHI